MTPIHQKQRTDRLLLVPVLVLILLSVPLALVIANGGFAAGEGFRSGALVKFVSSNTTLSAENVERAVESIINQDVRVTQNSNLFQVEVSSAIDNASINSLKSGLTSRGMWDNSHTFTADVFGAFVSAAQVQSTVVAAVGALIAIALIAMLLYRRRAAIFSMPLVAGVSLIEVLGVMALLSLSISNASLVGVMSVLVYSVNTNVFIASRMLKGTSVWSKEQFKRTMRSGMEMGAVTAAVFLLFGAFTMDAQALVMVAIFLAGAGLNLLNTWLVGAEVLARFSKKPEVSQHVAP